MPFDDEDPPYVEPDRELDALVNTVIGLAIEVHKQLGPGLGESLYEGALCVELRAHRIPFVRQPLIPVLYKSEQIGECRIDLLIAGKLVVELKAVEALAPIHKAQVITYLKVLKLELGLLINFNTILLKDGIKRVIYSQR